MKFYFISIRFELELEKWGVGDNAFKETTTTQSCAGWTEDWEKEIHKVDGALN